MKSIRILILAAGVAALAFPATTFAGNKANKASKPKVLIKQYDTNGNGSIDGSEVDALRKAFEADKTGPLKQFDTDSDGTLSDAEITAIKAPAKGAKKKNS